MTRYSRLTRSADGTHVSSAVTHVASIAGLIALTLIYAWPLISSWRVSIPGFSGFADVTEYVWSTGWVAQALSSDKSLLHTDALFFPFGADLRLNTFGLFQGLLAFPLTRLFGVIGAYNLVLIFTLALNGVMGYLLTFHLTNHSQASFISGSLFLLSPPILQHIVLGRAALGSMWIVIAVLLALHLTLARPSVRNTLLLGATLTAALLTDFQILLFSALWSCVYLVGLMFKEKLHLISRARLISLGLVAAALGVTFFLIYGPVFSSSSLSNYPEPTFKDMSRYSLRWWDFVTPNSIPHVYGVGFGVLAILAIATFRWRGEYRLWLIAALFFALLSLGPFLLPTDVPLPFAGLSIIQALRQFRTPYRLIMPAQVGFMIVAGLALSYWLQRVRSKYLSGTLCATLVVAHLFQASSLQPFRVQTYPDYAFYNGLTAEPETFTLLEVPFGIRSGLERIGDGGEVVQYYQHIHRKRLLNGSMARVPKNLFEFYRAQPALVFLSGERVNVDASELDRNFAEILQWADSRYVILHRRLTTNDEYIRFLSFLDSQPMLKQFAVEKDLVIYARKYPS